MTIVRLAACCLAVAVSAAQADTEFEVGRITAIFKEQGWKAGAVMPFDHEINSAMGTYRGAARVFTLSEPDGEPVALIFVGVSYPQVNTYWGRGNCPNDARYYIRDVNRSTTEDSRCVVSGGPYDGSPFVNGSLRGLSAGNKIAPLRAPDKAYFVHVWGTARNSNLIEVEVVVTDRFAGIPGGKPVGEAPALLRPEVAAWADGMADAAIKGLTSFGAKLVVPPVTFAAAQK